MLTPAPPRIAWPAAKMNKARKPRRTARTETSRSVPNSVKDWLQLAQLRAEKCELGEARANYLEAFQEAKRRADLRGMMEAASGLLRLAGEALDEEAIAKYDRELDQLIRKYPKAVPP